MRYKCLHVCGFVQPCRLHVRACMCEGVMINLEVCIVRPRQMYVRFLKFALLGLGRY